MRRGQQAFTRYGCGACHQVLLRDRAVGAVGPALDRGLAGTLVAASSYFMKSPPIQIHDDVAYNRVEAFIRGDDNETLDGTQAPEKRKLRKLAPAHAKAAVSVS